jgi:alpha-L-fucosidase
LILNIPPDRRGLFHENDVKSLLGWKKMIDDAFSKDLALHTQVKSDTYRGSSKLYAPANVTDGKKETYWATDDNVTKGNLTIDLGSKKMVTYISLQEYIKLGQRVKGFTVFVWKNNAWAEAVKGTTIGYKRILKIEPVETEKVKIEITDSKASPLISNLAIY